MVVRDIGRSDIAGEVGELLHLSRCGIRELGTTVADVHVPQSRKSVEILATVDVLNGGSAPSDVNDGIGVIAWMMQRVDQVLSIECDELRSGQRHCEIVTPCHRST